MPESSPANSIFGLVDDRERFIKYLEILIFTPGELILKQDDYGNELYILVSGSIKIVATYKGHSEQVAMIEDRGVIGEIAFTTEFGKRTASVYAETGCVLLKLTQERFAQFLIRYPRAAAEFLWQLTQFLGDKLAKTTETLVNVHRNLDTIGQDYGVEDFSKVLASIDKGLEEIAGREQTDAYADGQIGSSH